jgi:hypothetical protein
LIGEDGGLRCCGGELVEGSLVDEARGVMLERVGGVGAELLGVWKKRDLRINDRVFC